MPREPLLESIALTIRDYRAGEVPAPDAAHVDCWVRQFDADVQDALLAEMDHVLKQSYLSRTYVEQFLAELARRSRLTEGWQLWERLCTVVAPWLRLETRGTPAHPRCPRDWRRATLLDLQKHGASQRELVQMLKELLHREYDRAAFADAADGPFLYLDDVLFTGNRIMADVQQWLRTSAPSRADLVIVVIALYRRGLRYSQQVLMRAARAAGKAIRIHWLRAVEFEDHPWATDTLDVLHPTCLPEVPPAQAYAWELAEAGYPLRLRVPGRQPLSRLFSSEAGRHLLEQQLLLAGLKIRAWYWHAQPMMRPLGYHALKGLGFGATVVTYRNCPNNCPLAWWWDTSAVPATRQRGAWYPLFPRKV